MVMRGRVFPPEELASFDHYSASRLLRLLKTLRVEPIILFLGAGVPASSGLPTWNELMTTICQTFFFHWQFQILEGSATTTRPPTRMSILSAQVEDDGSWGYLEAYTEADIPALVEDLKKSNAPLVAQQIKNCIRDLDWVWLLRKMPIWQADSPLSTHRTTGFTMRRDKLCAGSCELQLRQYL
jgi:hypothetical protein